MKKLTYLFTILALSIMSSCQQEDFLPEPPPDDNPQDSIIVDTLQDDTVIVDTTFLDTLSGPFFARVIIEETGNPQFPVYGDGQFTGCGFMTTVNDSINYFWNYGGIPGQTEDPSGQMNEQFYIEPYEVHNGDHIRIKCAIPPDPVYDFGYMITLKIGEYIKILDLKTNSSDTLAIYTYEWTVNE